MPAATTESGKPMTRMPPSNRPHIVLITCHDLGRWLGCYGVDSVRSPHLDALAAEGVRFAQAYCTAPGCSPSRAALATGRCPHANGVMGLAHPPFGWDLYPGEQPIAAQLAAHGYTTHLFGLQHVTRDISRLGFQHAHRREGAANGRPYHAPDVAAEVVAFLGAAQPSTPLYLEINLEEPHRPYDQGGVLPDATRGVTVPPYLPDTVAARDEFAALQGAIHAADAAIGRIVAALDGAGLRERTLLVFTTDHGVAMPRAKCTLYDPGIGVALIVRWPEGGVGGGREIAPLVSNVDVLPTLLAAAGVPAPLDLQGRSFLPLLRGEPYQPRDAIFAEKTYHSYYDPMRAIRTERHKFIRNFDKSFLVEVPGDVQVGPIYRSEDQLYVAAAHPDIELYDLAADPTEQHNLAGNPALAAIERDLDTRLWRWMAATDDPLLRGPIPSPSYRRTMEAFRRARGDPDVM